ncbi:hypothetical protein BBI10_06930 [Pseudomonas graminis]|uniref:Uncharacterized protein n=1 Tax=Pseudomonas graminis TaxID=158627 RepID=A0A1C2E9S8_9PSED|nr:hypothetical protein BBI10_06930 [Pseudomonas graminis]
MFWLIGVWFLPERLLILKYFRGYIVAGVVITLFGSYVHEKGSGILRRIGKAFLGIGFGVIGAFFALCFYVAISFTFFK